MRNNVICNTEKIYKAIRSFRRNSPETYPTHFTTTAWVQILTPQLTSF